MLRAETVGGLSHYRGAQFVGTSSRDHVKRVVCTDSQEPKI